MAQAKAIEIIFKSEQTQQAAGYRRLEKEDDADITTVEQAEAYLGPRFVDGEGCSNLNFQQREGMFQVNTGETSYLYPMHEIARVKVEWHPVH